MKTRGPVFRTIAFFLNGLILWNITSRSATPEKVTSLWMAIPAFLTFLYFLSAILSAGAILRVKMKLPAFTNAESGFIDLAFGSIGIYLLAYFLTGLGLFSVDYPWLLWAILALFYGYGVESIQYQRWFDFAKTKTAKVFLAVPLLILFLRLLEGFELHAHGDAYITYLPGPRLWAEQGSFHGFLNFSQFFLTTSFESLFAWGSALMGLKGGTGLELAQYFSQWCVGGLALLGIFLGTLSLCQRLAKTFPVADVYFPIVAVAALQVPSLRWTANLAKNDMGVAFWALSAFYFTLFLAPLSATLAFVAGVLTGAAVIGKLTLVFFGFCLGVYLAFFSPKRLIWFSLGGIAGALPVFIRNFALTQNPVFPWLPGLFPSSLLSAGQTDAAMHATRSAFLVSNVLPYSIEIAKELPCIFVLFIAFWALKKRADFLKLISVSLLATLLYTVFLRPSTEIRYQNVSLILLAIFSAFFSFQLLTFLPTRFNRFLSPLLAIVLVATANISTFTLFQIGSDKFSPISKALAQMTGGDAKLWIRKNLKPENSILLVGDPHLYYLIDYPISEIHQTPSLDDIFSNDSAASFTKALLDSPFANVCIETDNAFWSDLPKAKALVEEMKKQNPICNRYSSAVTQVWNLECLRNLKDLPKDAGFGPKRIPVDCH